MARTESMVALASSRLASIEGGDAFHRFLTEGAVGDAADFRFLQEEGVVGLQSLVLLFDLLHVSRQRVDVAYVAPCKLAV